MASAAVANVASNKYRFVPKDLFNILQ